MQNYVNRVQVGLSTGLDSNKDTLASLGRGDMLVLDSNLLPITAAAADNNGPRKSFYVAVGTGDANSPFILSAPIFGDNVRSYLGKSTRAAAEQVSYVGYNGTSGDIGAIVDEEEYKVVVNFDERLRLIANKQARKVLSVIADGTDKLDLLEDLIAVGGYSAPYADPYGLKVEAVSNGSKAATDNDITVVKGTNTILFATAATHSVGTDYAVDDIIGIDDITYKIIAVNALIITLSRNFSGASGTVVKANVDRLTSITGFGLKFSALAAPLNNAAIDKYEKVSFDLGVGETFSGAVASYVIVSDLGQGIFEQVRQMEADVQHNLGFSDLRGQFPAGTQYDFHAVSGIAYDVIQLIGSDKHEGDLQGQMESPVGLSIAFSTSSNAQRDNITPIIDSLIPNAVGLDGAW